MKCICNFFLILALICASLGYSDDIFLPNNPIHITSPIVITNSNTTLRGGNDTVLFLKNLSDCPVLIIGNPSGSPVTNVEVSNLSIDGNRIGQTKELWKSLTNGIINNNGIIVQNAKNIRIHDVSIRNCRSGGLITTFKVQRLDVRNVSSFNNEFDGIACYETIDSTFSNLILYDNRAAGISLDDYFDFNQFNNISISNNSVGIFMRNSRGNKFTDISIKKCDLNIFISHVNDNFSSGCVDNIFDRISANGRFIINTQTCTNNVFKF